MIWGVSPLMVEYCNGIEELFEACAMRAKEADYVDKDDHVVISAGVPVDVPGNTNIIKVLQVK